MAIIAKILALNYNFNLIYPRFCSHPYLINQELKYVLKKASNKCMLLLTQLILTLSSNERAIGVVAKDKPRVQVLITVEREAIYWCFVYILVITVKQKYIKFNQVKAW